MPRANRSARILVSDEENPPELARMLADAATANDPPKPSPAPHNPPLPDDPGVEPPREDDTDEPDEDGPDEDEDEDEDEDDEDGDDIPAASSHPSGPILDGELMPRSDVTYEARIQILDAWQYPGAMGTAPGWVDRNWIGFADYDQLRGIEPGPCLRVPSPGSSPGSASPGPSSTGEVAVCRIGDYVARQEMRIGRDAGANASVVRIEVWARENFEKLFLPVTTRG